MFPDSSFLWLTFQQPPYGAGADADLQPTELLGDFPGGSAAPFQILDRIPSRFVLEHIRNPLDYRGGFFFPAGLRPPPAWRIRRGFQEFGCEDFVRPWKVTTVPIGCEAVQVYSPQKYPLAKFQRRSPQRCFWPATATRVESIPYRRPTEPSHPEVARPHRGLVRKSFSFISFYLDFGPVHCGQFCAPCRIRRISTAFPRMR